MDSGLDEGEDTRRYRVIIDDGGFGFIGRLDSILP